jgi:hypothetical protein
MTIRSGVCPYCSAPYSIAAGGCSAGCMLARAVASIVADAARAGVTELDELASIAVGVASGYPAGAELARIYRGRPAIARLECRRPAPWGLIAGAGPATVDRWRLYDASGAPYDTAPMTYRELLSTTDDARDI